MRVAFLFLHPFSGSLGSTVRVKELASHLSKFNVESYICTPYEKTQTLTDGVTVVSVAGALQKLNLNGFLYKLTKFAYYNPFFIKHFMTSKRIQCLFAKNSASSIEKALNQFSVQVIQVEQDFALPTAIEVKKRTGLPLIVDLHNITSEELVASGAIKRDSAVFFKLQNMLKKNLNEADEVIVVSDLMKEYVVANYGLLDSCVHVVPPGANQRESIKANSADHPKIVYSGLVAYREHVDLFVKSMPLVQQRIKNAEFYITDKGEDVKKIKKLSKQLAVRPIFFWYPAKQDFIDFVSSCSLGVLTSSNDLARKMGVPAKLFDYLSVGLPVVANDIAAWTDIIRQESLGVVTADDPEFFAEAIISLLENSSLRAKYSENAKRIAKVHTWDNSANILWQVLRKVSGCNKIVA